jgi:dTDP-4-amino-4,6-dideoxygalactose transaminase
VSVLSLAPEGIITTGAGAAVFARERRELKGLREAVESRPRDALLSDLNAALGLAQAREIEGFLKSRRSIAEVFSQAVARCGTEAGPCRGTGRYAFSDGEGR